MEKLSRMRDCARKAYRAVGDVFRHFYQSCLALLGELLRPLGRLNGDRTGLHDPSLTSAGILSSGRCIVCERFVGLRGLLGRPPVTAGPVSGKSLQEGNVMHGNPQVARSLEKSQSLSKRGESVSGPQHIITGLLNNSRNNKWIED